MLSILLLCERLFVVCMSFFSTNFFLHFAFVSFISVRVSVYVSLSISLCLCVFVRVMCANLCTIICSIWSTCQYEEWTKKVGEGEKHRKAHGSEHIWLVCVYVCCCCCLSSLLQSVCVSLLRARVCFFITMHSLHYNPVIIDVWRETKLKFVNSSLFCFVGVMFYTIFAVPCSCLLLNNFLFFRSFLFLFLSPYFVSGKFGWAEDRKQGHDGNGHKYERSIKLQWKCERNRTDGLASESNRIEASPSMKFCLQCHAAQLKPSNPTPAGECSGRYRCVSYRCYFPNYTISGIKRRTNKKTKKSLQSM